jgi:hypothetical protein
MRQGYEDIQYIPIFERKWLIDRFFEQKQKEKESYDKSSKGGNRHPVSVPRFIKNGK